MTNNMVEVKAMMPGFEAAALMDETDPTFQAAADFVESHASNVADGRKLDLYGLYKQATSGPCSTAKPSFFDLRGRAKWYAAPC